MMSFKFIETDRAGATKEIFIELTNFNMRLRIYFYTHNGDLLGQSGLTFPIFNQKIFWRDPPWISEKAMAYCDKLVKLKAFS